MQEGGCLLDLLNQNAARCNTSNPRKYKAIEKVKEGVIILNDNQFVIRDGKNSETSVNGTFLLIFNDEITINGVKFKNREHQAYSEIDHPGVQKIEFERHLEDLTLENIQEVDIRNIKRIATIKQKIEKENTNVNIIMWTTIVILIIVCLIKLFNNKNIKIWTRRQPQQRNNFVIEEVLRQVNANDVNNGE